MISFFLKLKGFFIALNIMDSFDWKHLLAEGIIMAKVVNVLCATMASDYLGFFCYQIIQKFTKKIHLNILAMQNVMCVFVYGIVDLSHDIICNQITSVVLLPSGLTLNAN